MVGMAVISNNLNTIWTLTKECFPTMPQAGIAMITALACQTIIGPIAEWGGRQIPPLPKQKIIIKLSKMYYRVNHQ